MKEAPSRRREAGPARRGARFKRRRPFSVKGLGATPLDTMISLDDIIRKRSGGVT